MTEENEFKVKKSNYTYPNIEIRTWYEREIRHHRNKESLIFNMSLDTYVRKKKDDLWYLIPVRMKAEQVLYPDTNHLEFIEKTITQVMEQFIHQVWNTYHLYIIDPRMRLYEDNRIPVFIDADQRSEEEIIKDGRE